MDNIEVSFEKFRLYVDRKFQAICGMSIDDVEDFDFYEYYPGESAPQIEYAQAVVDAARACLENAAGFDVAQELT
jgi:hypothetical protein